MSSFRSPLACFSFLPQLPLLSVTGGEYRCTAEAALGEQW